MEKQKKLGVNFIYSFIKTLMGVIFPLITYPYALRVLGPDGTGKVDYAQANITYFTLIGAFGIASYAIREGARIRDDKEKMNKFASQMFSINICSMVIACFLAGIMIFIPYFRNYQALLFIFSLTIVLSSIGVEWIYNIYEDYKYITIRTVLFQLVSVILLFVFVKDKDDYVIYAAILVLSSVGSNILNFFRARRYVKLSIGFNKDLLVHIKPMTLIFVMNVASSIYLIMDRSMLGYMTNNNDTEVGLYSAAVKIITVIVSLIASIRTVVIPRVSYYMENSGKNQVEQLNYSVAKLTLMLSIPSVVGLFCLGKTAILLFAGAEYVSTTVTLKILLFDIILSTMNGMLVNQIFIPLRKEKWATIATIIGAGTNLILNAITIPLLGRNGAAISTCVAEFAIFVFCMIIGREYLKFSKLIKSIVQYTVASLGIIIMYFLFNHLIENNYIVMAGTIGSGAILYFIILIISKNEMMSYVLNVVKSRLKK